MELHDSLDNFRLEVRRPWWVSAAVTGTTIDLAPAALLAQREGVEATLRTAMAEFLMSTALVTGRCGCASGGARYFAAAARPASSSARGVLPG